MYHDNLRTPPKVGDRHFLVAVHSEVLRSPRVLRTGTVDQSVVRARMRVAAAS